MNADMLGKYFEVLTEEFDIPLNGTWQGKRIIELKKGDVFKVHEKGITFIGLDNGKDVTGQHHQLVFSDIFISANSNLNPDNKTFMFFDVTPRYTRHEKIDELLSEKETVAEVVEEVSEKITPEDIMNSLESIKDDEKAMNRLKKFIEDKLIKGNE